MVCGWFCVASSGDNVQGASCFVAAVLGFSGVFLVGTGLVHLSTMGLLSWFCGVSVYGRSILLGVGTGISREFFL